MRSFALFLFLSAIPSLAHAHLGHLGDVAGHSHWIALGAGVVATALAVWLGKDRLKDEGDANGEEAAIDGEGELEGEVKAAYRPAGA